MNENNKEIDHEATDEMICPYCGDSTEREGDPNDYSGEHECGECGKIFTCEVDISVSFSTSKDCKLNKEEHKYILCQRHPMFDVVECEVCKLRFYNKHPVTGEALWESASGTERVMIEGSKREW